MSANKIIIEVSGGIVQAVISANMEDVYVIDHDNHEVGLYVADPGHDAATLAEDTRDYRKRYLLELAGLIPAEADEGEPDTVPSADDFEEVKP